MKNHKNFLENRLVFQHPGAEATQEAAKEVMSAEAAKEQLMGRAGSKLILDASLLDKMVESRNEPSKFEAYKRDLFNASYDLKKGQDSKLKQLLPPIEQTIVGGENLILNRLNYADTVKTLHGIAWKLMVFEHAKSVYEKSRTAPNNYMFNLDMAVKLVEGKQPFEAGQYLQDNINVREHLSHFQTKGELNQTEVNGFLKTVNQNPSATLARLLKYLEQKDKNKAEEVLRGA